MARSSDAAGAGGRDSLRAAFEGGETLEVIMSGAPLPDLSEPSSAAYLRTANFGVTAEAPGRYAALPNAELGRGAIGRVYLADDLHLGRQVAIKELLAESTDPSAGSRALSTISRFLREARVTGVLEHPNIVPVYELGRRADGALYYTMRVVPGRTLAQAIDESQGLNERLALVNHFSGLCQAIAYAHSRNVVHRDIKPDNVMIGEFGETVVLDWGMAKPCADGRRSDSDAPRLVKINATDLALTQEGSLCGTPLYMSPEQFSGRSRDVDQRSDVWSLGVVLYNILSGRPPFTGNSLLELVAQVRGARYTPLVELDPQIPPELAAVVERALQGDPGARYPSARELARDIQAYQAGTRVAAYEYSSFELLQRFVARHRSAVIASGVALVVTLVLSFTAYRRVVAARDRALIAERRAVEHERLARQSSAQARHSLGEVLLDRAEQALLEGDSVDAELLAARALVQEERPDARGVVIAARSSLRPTLSHTYPETKGCLHSALSFSAKVFACTMGRELLLFSLRDGEPRRRLPLASEATALAIANDSSALAVATADGALQVRSTTAPDELSDSKIRRCGPKPTAVALTATPGGLVAACASARGEISVWRGNTEQHWTLGQAVSALAFSTDGERLVVGGELGALVVYDASGHVRHQLTGHTGTVLALAWADPNRYLASGAADRMVRFWDLETGSQVQAPLMHSDAIAALGWSADRRFLTIGGKDKLFRALDLRSGRSALARQHDDALELAAISSDASQLASYSRDTGLRIWTLASRDLPSELNERGNVLTLGRGAGPDQVISAGLGRNGVCVWSLSTGSCETRLPVRLDRVRALAVSLDRKKLALAGSGTEMFIWDLVQNIPTQVIAGLRDETRALAFSADGRTLIAAGLDRTVRVFDVASAALLREQPMTAPIQTVSVLDSGQLVIGDQAGVLTTWDPKSGKVLSAWQAHADWVLNSAVSPDGSLLATAGADRWVKIWDARTLKHLFSLPGHDGRVFSVDFSLDGALLASAGEDKTVRVWNARTGAALATLKGHAGIVRAVRFAEAQSLLISGSDDGAIKLWQLRDLTRSGQELERDVSRQFGLASQ